MNRKLRKVLEELTGAYYEDSPENAEYPYAVFSLQKLGEEEGIEKYILEINVWDQHAYCSRAEKMTDDLEKLLHRGIFYTENFLIRIFADRRQNIPDQDKNIKHIREQYEMKVCRKEG